MRRPYTAKNRGKRDREKTTGEVAASAANADGQALSGKEESVKSRHAMLHDFCMGLPYGTIFLVGGVAAVPFVGAKGLAFSLCGALVLLLSIMSLKSWRKRKTSTAYTIGGSCAAAVALWQSQSFVQAPYTMYTTIPALATVLSGMMALFLLYNVLAGGNPPKSEQ